MSLLKRKNKELYNATIEATEIVKEAENQNYPAQMKKIQDKVDDDLFTHINRLFKEDYRIMYDFLSRITDIIGGQKKYRKNGKHMPREMRIEISRELSVYMREENLIEEDKKILKLTDELINELDEDKSKYQPGSNKYQILEILQRWAIKLEPQLKTIIESAREIDRIVQENPSEFGLDENNGDLRM